LRGRDIKRYSYEFADKYVILAYFGSYKILPSKYPAIYNHLKQYEEKLKERGQCRYTSSGRTNNNGEYLGQHHWLELDNNPRLEYLEEFNKQKIVYQELTQGSQFAYDANGEYYINNTAYLITGKELKYLLAFLNSTLINFVYSRFYSTRIGGKGVRWLYQNMIMLPIIKREKLQKRTVKQINSLIDRVLTNENRTKKQMLDTEKLDILIYKIYKLTDEEMKFVSSSVRSK